MSVIGTGFVAEVGNRPAEEMLSEPVVAGEESNVVHRQQVGGSTRERDGGV